MKIYENPDKKALEQIFSRPSKEERTIQSRVISILDEIKKEGNNAIFRLSKAIDKHEIDENSILVNSDEYDSAESILSDEFKAAIAQAKENIEAFHRAQLREPIKIEALEGISLEQRRVAISRVGLYIPGGTAPLFSTVLMCAIPAQIAGCNEVILCTPANSEGRISPEILYVAKVCGIDKVYKLGGAIAIGAMAYGCESIGKVDKIFGPGNRYVTYAKQLVSASTVAIDLPAGPSEVMVLADHSADASFVAADLLSQLEHGVDSQAIAIVTDIELAKNIETEVYKQLKSLDRTSLLNESINNCHIIVEKDRDKILTLADEYAAEHLIIALVDAENYAYKIHNAGSIFIGNYSPESAGDYASGTNHTLPTSGWARAFSGVNVDTFSKYITYQNLSSKGLGKIAKTVMTMAEHEGLTAHKNAVKIRLKENSEV